MTMKTKKTHDVLSWSYNILFQKNVREKRSTPKIFGYFTLGIKLIIAICCHVWNHAHTEMVSATCILNIYHDS